MFEGIFAPTHLLIVLAIVLVVYGPQKLPELGKGLGEALSGFKKALDESSATDTATQTTHDLRSQNSDQDR